MKKKKVVVSWSGGKDSAFALYEILQNPHYDVCGLLTTVTTEYDRISMHGVRRRLLHQQVRALKKSLEDQGSKSPEVEQSGNQKSVINILNKNGFSIRKSPSPKPSPQEGEGGNGKPNALGYNQRPTTETIPLYEIFLSPCSSNDEYESKMKEMLLSLKAQGINHVVFGDLFLEDIRAYREKNMARMDMEPVFPLWKRDTRELAHQFIALGFEAILVCVDSRPRVKQFSIAIGCVSGPEIDNPRRLDGSFCGRLYDESLLRDFPTCIDPCGENGEFHTYVFKGPLFRQKVSFQKGDVVERNGFHFCDLLPID